MPSELNTRAKLSLLAAVVAQPLDRLAVREIDDWSRRSEFMPPLTRAKMCRDSAFANRLVWEAVDMLASASGGSFSSLGNIANRIWQDVKVGTQHPFTSPASTMRLTAGCLQASTLL